MTQSENFADNQTAQTHVVVGANWGDEGKGRMVDYFAQATDIVVRYQGGNNAGHTVINEHGEFKLHLLPSGVFNPITVNVLGPGMVIDLAGLRDELTALTERNIHPNLLISDRATLVLTLHRLEDEWEEQRLGDEAFGSTRNGIAYAYADRHAKKALQVGMLLNDELLQKNLRRWYDWKVPMLAGLYPKADIPSFSSILTQLQELAEQFRDRIGSVERLYREQPNARLLLEAQLGSLRDLSFGNYPYTTSSHVLAAHAPVGSGALQRTPDRITAVVKAFSSSVGSGPLPTAMPAAQQQAFREVSGEFGARTGRPRDLGFFDAVATRYGVSLQNATELALTKLDCLSGFGDLQICVGYRLDDELLSDYPLTDELYRVTPVYETLPGWTEDISEVRHYEQLPAAARHYIERIEQLLQCPVRFISVGPERRQLILR